MSTFDNLDACADPQDKVIWCEPFSLQLRYRYNSTEQRCHWFINTGCGRSENNFETMTECENACLRTLTAENGKPF